MPHEVNRVNPVSLQNRSESVATEVAYTPSKPVLAERLIALRSTSGKLADGVMGLTLDRIEREKADLITALQEQFKLELSRNWTDTAWSYVDFVSKACMVALTFFTGGALLFQGQGKAGSALLAAGFLDATQQLFTTLGIWDEVAEALAENDESKRDRLKTVMPLVLSFLQVALTISGAQGLANYKALFQGAQTGLGMATVAGKTGVSIYKANLDVQRAEQKAEQEIRTQNISLESRFVTAIAEERRRIQKVIKQTVLSLIKHGIEATET